MLPHARSRCRDPRPHRPEPDRAAPHRDGADGAVQLPVRAAHGRHVHPPARGHGPGPRLDRLREGHPRRAALARARLGRGSGGGRRGGPRSVRAVSPDAAPRRSTRRPPRDLLAADLAYPCYCTPEELEADRKAQEAARQPPRYVGRCADAHRRGARRARGRGPARPLRFRVGTGVVAFDDIVRGRVEIDVVQPRRRLRDRPRRRHAALPLHGRRRRRRDGDQPRHPRRGPPLEHAQAHPAVPGARPPDAALRPPAAHPQRRPHEDEQAQEPDRGRPTTSPRASSARRWSTTSRCSAGRPGPRRRSSRSTRSSSASTSPARPQGRRGVRPRAARVAQRPVDPPARAGRPRRPAAAVPRGRAGRRPDRPDAGGRRAPRPAADRPERLPTLGAIGDLVGFLWVDDLAVDPATLVPEALGRGDDARGARRGRARSIADVGAVTFEADELEPPLRALAEARGWKAGDLFMAIRVAVTGRTATPPLFDTLVALGRERTLERLDARDRRPRGREVPR